MTVEELIREAIEKYEEAEKLVNEAVNELNRVTHPCIWISHYSRSGHDRKETPNPIFYKVDRLKAVLKIPEALKKPISL